MGIVATASPRTQSSAPSPVGAYDRLFYGGMAIAMAALIFAGFAPTYYMKFFGDGARATVSGGPFTPLVHLHGALFTGWVLLFIAQTALVASHRLAVHRRLGVAGAVLAAAIILATTSLAVATTKRGGAPEGVDPLPPLAGLALAIFDMVNFATFVTAALVLRRNKEAHKRLMLLASISITVAGVARLPGVFFLAPLAFYYLGYSLVVVAVIYDLVSRRRVHKAYLWGGALLFASVPLRLAIAKTGLWHAFAQALTK